MPDESDDPPGVVVGRGEGFIAAMAARYGPDVIPDVEVHQRRGDSLGALAKVVEADPGLALHFAQAEECDAVAARVRATAEREDPEWIAAGECESIIADAEEVADCRAASPRAPSWPLSPSMGADRIGDGASATARGPGPNRARWSCSLLLMGER